MWGGLSESQINDIIESKVGFNKVKIPAAVAADYAGFSAAVASSEGAGTPAAVTISTSFGGTNGIRAGATTRAGERITDTTKRNMYLNSATFKLFKSGAPTGAIVATLRKTSDDSIVATSTTSIDASTLTGSYADYVFNFPAGTKTPNEDFRISVEYNGGDASNSVAVAADLANSYAGGQMSLYTGSWTDNAANETTGSYNVSPIQTASLAVDSNTGTFWKSNSETNPNIYADIGSNKLISGCRIYWDAANRPTNYTIEAMDAGTRKDWATASTGSLQMYGGALTRLGEKVTDATLRQKVLITATFWMGKTGSPAGNILCRIRRTSDDGIVATAKEQVVASSLGGAATEYTFTFDTLPLTPNEDFRILLEYSGGDVANYVSVHAYGSSDVYLGGNRTSYNGSYSETLTDDIRGSATFGSFVTVDSETSQPTAGQYVEYPFNTVLARYIRVKSTDAGSNVIEVAEMQYYSKTTDQVLSTHGHGDV